MSNADYMKRYRERYPEYAEDENRQRRARTEAMRKLRIQFRVEYECYLADALKDLQNGVNSND
jgi:hypothetical protein